MVGHSNLPPPPFAYVWLSYFKSIFSSKPTKKISSWQTETKRSNLCSLHFCTVMSHQHNDGCDHDVQSSCCNKVSQKVSASPPTLSCNNFHHHRTKRWQNQLSTKFIVLVFSSCLLLSSRIQQIHALGKFQPK